MTKNVILVEFNEFNTALLNAAVQTYSLPALAKILSFKRTQYKTDDTYESDFLEPWVQWVSIHSGVPSSMHQIKHLGDIPDLSFEQFWETLSSHDISLGIWGIMNGARNKAINVKFFLPDPWTFSEKAYPLSLNHLLDLPRYVSKNYQNLKKSHLVINVLKLIKFLSTSKCLLPIIKATKQLLKDLKIFDKKHFVYISNFDYISTLAFTQYKKKYNPKCSILFLNSLAHLQHHHWSEGATTVTKEILYGLKMLDKTFSHLFTHFKDDAFVIHNGLSQMNTNHEKTWVLYRQKDPVSFLQALKIPVLKVEQLMTHDGHVFFKTSEDCQQAFEHLSNASIDNKKLFQVEKNKHDSSKLFYMLAFTDEIKNKSQMFLFNEKSYVFFEYFDVMVTRTGKHIPAGTVFSNIIEFPDQIYNHDFNRYVFNYLKPEQFSLQQENSI